MEGKVDSCRHDCPVRWAWGAGTLIQLRGTGRVSEPFQL